MENKIEEAIKYYNFKSSALVHYINSSSNLTVDEIIEKSEELAVLEYKMTALEVAKEN
jgi:hypothetical protein